MRIFIRILQLSPLDEQIVLLLNMHDKNHVIFNKFIHDFVHVNIYRQQQYNLPILCFLYTVYSSRLFCKIGCVSFVQCDEFRLQIKAPFCCQNSSCFQLSGLSLEAGYRWSSGGCEALSHRLLGHVRHQILQKYYNS